MVSNWRARSPRRHRTSLFASRTSPVRWAAAAPSLESVIPGDSCVAPRRQPCAPAIEGRIARRQRSTQQAVPGGRKGKVPSGRSAWRRRRESTRGRLDNFPSREMHTTSDPAETPDYTSNRRRAAPARRRWVAEPTAAIKSNAPPPRNSASNRKTPQARSNHKSVRVACPIGAPTPAMPGQRPC